MDRNFGKVDEPWERSGLGHPVRTIWGDVPRLGDVNPQREPYRTELADDRITVYDLTHLANLGRVLINPIL